MGIQGLLPLLKPIQRHRHLSEFAEQTLAVDAYVWLHRGAYACAAELVQGRPTRRYVDFCMARVRLLRHHRIEPYLVFDGGPLPAKLSTEKEREKRREENARRAKELLAQGKSSQAAEFFTKCVDVTPQMAHQVIKALKAEGVQYVVAPYEADAQLAYLEREGLVDGIITEDSDLLVFGCRNVHVKLDAVSATVVSISRTDFGSPALAKDSFSFIGWSEAQFRWMAMLSGCDYLPSIAGVGLKTAYHLLKKYKAVDKAVKMMRLEGKKTVPKDYLDSFYLAEKVFLHQRVYDPRAKKLVYLTNPSENLCLSDEIQMYVGRDIEPSLAARIAEGDVCPITLTDMEDINPSFMPQSARAGPLRRHDTNRVGTPDSRPSRKKGSLLSFFVPVSKPHQPPPMQSSIKTVQVQPRMLAGNASGKRTLADVMEHDTCTKRKRVTADRDIQRTRRLHSTSHFFSGPRSSLTIKIDDSSVKENIHPTSNSQVPEHDDPVTQEDGYLSPSPCLLRDATPDISSPILSCKTTSRHSKEALDDTPSQDRQESSSRGSVERVLVRASSEPLWDQCEDVIPGPDLASNLEIDDGGDEADRYSDASSEILCWEDSTGRYQKESLNVLRHTSESLPLTMNRAQKEPTIFSDMRRSASLDDPTDELELLEIDEEDAREKERNAVQERLAQKWRMTYSLETRGVASLTNAKAAMTSREETPKVPQGRTAKRTPVSRASWDSDVKCTRQRPVPKNDGLQNSKNHVPKRRGLPAPVVADSRGSRIAPILIDVEVADKTTYDPKAQLQEFRMRVLPRAIVMFDMRANITDRADHDRSKTVQASLDVFSFDKDGQSFSLASASANHKFTSAT
ncbi:hypothetical protein ACEPAG_4775 [Sanghuangporus baumii]